MNYHTLTYWVSLANIKNIPLSRKNRILVEYYNRCNKDAEQAIVSLFEDDESRSCLLTEEEEAIFKNAKATMPNTAFTVEKLLAQHFSIIPIASSEYPKLLKKRRKLNSPIVLYAKGNVSLLNQESIAIVGARSAKKKSLDFTELQAAKAVREGKVVVSGGAKGVDTKALETAIANNGRSVIVLPQGITTYQTGFRKYYRQLVHGDILVISEFEPEAGWNKGLAMARNKTIYSLGASILVAESGSEGGTWEGALNGVKSGWPVFVRWAEENEDNANRILVLEHGATAIDFDGNIIQVLENSKAEHEKEFCEKIIDLLKVDQMTSKAIIAALGCDFTDPKMKTFIREKLQGQVEEIRKKNKPIYFRLLNKTETGLLF